MILDRYNAEHYHDPTAYEALNEVAKTEKRQKQKIKLKLIQVKLFGGEIFYCEKLEFYKDSVLLIGLNGRMDWVVKSEISFIGLKKKQIA